MKTIKNSLFLLQYYNALIKYQLRVSPENGTSEITIDRVFVNIDDFKTAVLTRLEREDYSQEFIDLNAFCIISDMSQSKAGTITAGEDRFMEWKTVDGNYENTQYATYDVLFEGMLEKTRLLDIIKNFVCFSKEDLST